MLEKLAESKKAVAAFLSSLVVAVPIGLETGAKWWAVLLPIVTTAITWLAPANAPAPIPPSPPPAHG